MKLSEAISLGSTLNPQAFGKVVDARGGRCAWGAAFEAMGLMAPDQEWSWTTRVVKCPHCYTVRKQRPRGSATHPMQTVSPCRMLRHAGKFFARWRRFVSRFNSSDPLGNLMARPPVVA